MKAVLCPVCKGDGHLKDAEIMGTEATKITAKLCHGCVGRGWVEVQDYPIPYPIETHEYTHFVDKCPTCGGERNSPAGTSCPLGSHYGSY